MPFRNTNKVSNSFNPDQALRSDLDQRLSADKWFRSTSGPMSVLIWIQTVCKGYQQTNGFDPHQDQCSVGSDLDPNCLQRLSADKWF